jgi:hypothetical protein
MGTKLTVYLRAEGIDSTERVFESDDAKALWASDRGEFFTVHQISDDQLHYVVTAFDLKIVKSFVFLTDRLNPDGSTRLKDDQIRGVTNEELDQLFGENEKLPPNRNYQPFPALDGSGPVETPSSTNAYDNSLDLGADGQPDNPNELKEGEDDEELHDTNY